MAIYMDDAPHVAGAVISLAILAYTSFALRVYVRKGKTWGMDDWCMTVASVSVSLDSRTFTMVQGDYLTGYSRIQLLFLVLTVACVMASFNGLGIHVFRFAEPGNEHYSKMGLKVGYSTLGFILEVFGRGYILRDVVFCYSTSSSSKYSTARPSYPSSSLLP